SSTPGQPLAASPEGRWRPPASPSERPPRATLPRVAPSPKCSASDVRRRIRSCGLDVTARRGGELVDVGPVEYHSNGWESRRNGGGTRGGFARSRGDR